MSIADKLTTIAENEQKVYDAGKQVEWSDFWDSFQNYGNRTNYQTGFYGSGWTETIYKPKYPLKCSFFASAFMYSNITDTMVDIVFSSSTDQQTVFSNCLKLKTIRNLDVTNYTKGYTNWFAGCIGLVNVSFTGEIKQSINFSASSPNVASCKNIIEHLANYAGTDKELIYKLTLPSKCWTALNNAETPPTGDSWKDYVMSLGWQTA